MITRDFYILAFTAITCFLQTILCSSSTSTTSAESEILILPLKTQEIPSVSKLPFRHNVTLTVSLAVGSPPQNVTMVLDTGSELSWFHCNTTTQNTTTTTTSNSFDPSRSGSYSPVHCSSPVCTNRTRDFVIPASCDPNDLCHATLSYADFSSSEGNLASDNFYIGSSNVSALIFGCMGSTFSSNSDEDAKTTGLMGMNRGSLSFVSQMAFPKFSYCISGSDLSGVLLLGEISNSSLLISPLNYTPLVQISMPLPYFDRVAYTVRLEGIKVSDKILNIPGSVFVPDHTGAGQTMVDSGTQFTFLLGAAYSVLREEFLNKTTGVLRVLEEPDFVFQGAMDLCYRVAMSEEEKIRKLPRVSLVFDGAEMSVSAESLLYRAPGQVRGSDSVYCFTFGNSDLLGVEAFLIGHHHQQNMWIEFDLQRSRIGLAQTRCDLAVQRLGLVV
ncbi:hypothetical protein TIFTF001_040804 [Ficus carica]|uniref:Peptidase A1 domain-containing protein n=1 Tax=Ficus carica TaxID=3494 RepID=A0AA87ZKY2_FICCA|nr:hypothetical protein TIFTF001_040804 [Ficus carica]